MFLENMINQRYIILDLVEGKYIPSGLYCMHYFTDYKIAESWVHYMYLHCRYDGRYEILKYEEIYR